MFKLSVRQIKLVWNSAWNSTLPLFPQVVFLGHQPRDECVNLRSHKCLPVVPSAVFKSPSVHTGFRVFCCYLYHRAVPGWTYRTVSACTILVLIKGKNIWIITHVGGCICVLQTDETSHDTRLCKTRKSLEWDIQQIKFSGDFSLTIL